MKLNVSKSLLSFVTFDITYEISLTFPQILQENFDQA